MDALAGLPVIGLVIVYAVAAWLLTRGIRRVIRLQFKRTHRRLDRNELVKFLLPIVTGSACAVVTPSLIFAWFGVIFPEGITLYVCLWSKIIIGGGAGLASALIYKAVRGWIRTRSAPSKSEVPPDADAP